jgi:hypothetical protein
MKIIFLTVFLFICCTNNIKKNQLPVKVITPKIFEELSPELQIFYFNPEIDNKVETKIGSNIYISKNSFHLPYYFKSGDLIKMEFKEYFYTPDFLSTGYSLAILENNTPKGLESAGMFDIKSYYLNSELNLRKNIEIEIPNINPGVSYNLYKIENNEWLHSGKNSQIAQNAPRSDQPFTIFKSKRLSEREEEKFIRLFRKFSDIDTLTTWNFDLPIDNSCILLNVKNLNITNNNNLFYSVFSTTKLRISFKWSNSNLIKAMVPTNDKVNIVFWHDNKLSIIKGISTPMNSLGKDQYPSEENCEDKGSINLDFQSEEIFKNPIERYKYLFY